MTSDDKTTLVMAVLFFVIFLGIGIAWEMMKFFAVYKYLWG